MVERVDRFATVRRMTLEHIPGVLQWRDGRRGMGGILFGYTVFFPFLALVYAGTFFDGLQSLVLTLYLLVADSVDARLFLRGDVIEHWVASLFILIMPFVLWRLHRRSVRRSREDGSEYERSQWLIAWREFCRNRIAVLALLAIVVMYTTALLCPIIAPYDPNAFQDGVVTQFQPPLSTVRILKLHEDRVPIREFEHITLETGNPRVLERLLRIHQDFRDAGFNRERAVDAFRIEQSDVFATEGDELAIIPISSLVSADPEEFADTRFHLMGTDSYGRDLFSRIIYGSRISLSLGFIAVLLSVTLGTFIGLVAGYFGRWSDSVIMRVVDILLAFPALFLILIIIAAFDQISVPRIFLIVVVLGLTSWMGIARLVRGEVLSLKEREFVLAAQALGLSHMRIMLRHILPNTLTPIIVNATLRIGGIILVEAALSYLNIGVQPPTASWGNIIFEGKDFMSNAWWISTLPGFAIVLVVVCFNLVGDGLRDAVDPTLVNDRRM